MESVNEVKKGTGLFLISKEDDGGGSLGRRVRTIGWTVAE
jgi:hypothetical protein